MNKKIWCLFGVHEYEIIDQGPYEKYWDDTLLAIGNYYILKCQCCGKIKRTVTCK